MVFQNYALYPHMTVAENISFSLRLRRVPKPEIRARVADVATMLGLDGLLDRRPRELSGGQRQRVALGRAIVRRPRAFLMDEPLSNLDAQLRTATRAELARLHRQLEATFVYVTHDQIEAMTMATRIAVMSAGRLQQLGTPAEVYDRPASTFVAQFIGTPPMNLLPAELVSVGQKLTAVSAAINVHVHDVVQSPDRAVMIGVRPEHLHPVSDDHDDDILPTIRSQVQAVEMLGSDLIVLIDVDGVTCAVRGPRSLLVQPGQALTLTCHRDHVHVFSPTTTRRIDTSGTMHASLADLVGAH
jgi:multiple sugar transport system ATP-binding protein